MEVYLVSCANNSSATPDLQVVEDLESAAIVVQEFFESYGFEIRDGKPYDGGNYDGEEGTQKPFDVFARVKMRKCEDGVLRVLEFVHHNGEGPIASVSKSKVRKVKPCSK